jgi:hypothetical protein
MVMLILADYADAEWSTFVGQVRLAEEAEMSERAVRGILADFETEGLISREKRYRDNGAGGRNSDRTTINRLALLGLPEAHAGKGLAAPAAGLPAPDDRVTGSSLAGEPLGEPPEEPGDSSSRAREVANGLPPHFSLLKWLATHRISDVSARLDLILERLSEEVGTERIVGLWERYAEDPTMTKAGQYILGADNQFHQIPKPQDLPNDRFDQYNL